MVGFEGFKILDSAGVLHSLEDATFVRNTGQKTYPGVFAAKLIEVDLRISRERQVDLNEVRRIVREALELGRGSWESAG